MTLTEEIAALRALLELASPQNFETAETRRDDEWLECPFCGGEGEVDGATITNYDGEAIGIQFFGVGDQFAHNEAAFRALWKAAPRLLGLLEAFEKALSDPPTEQEIETVAEIAHKALRARNSGARGQMLWLEDGSTYQDLAAFMKLRRARVLIDVGATDDD